MDNSTRRELLNKAKSIGYPGNILEVFSAYDQGRDLLSEYAKEQQQQQLNMQVAQTPEEQGQGLRPYHEQGQVNQSMAFPNIQPGQSFSTEGMKIPINIDKIDNQGNLVESYKSVPPGIQNFPTGPYAGTVIESPAKSYASGGPNIGGMPMPTLPQEEPQQEEAPQMLEQQPPMHTNMHTPGSLGNHMYPFMKKGQSGEMYYDATAQMQEDQPIEPMQNTYFKGGLRNRVRYNKAKYKR